MKFRMLLGFSLLALSQTSMANDEYVTVCGYTPADTFQEPEEITLKDSYTYTTCPPTTLVTVMVTRKIVIGGSSGDTVIISQERENQMWDLLYELPGGY